MPVSTEGGDETPRKGVEEDNKENIPPPSQRPRFQPSPSDPRHGSSKTMAVHLLQSEAIPSHEQRHAKERFLHAYNEKPRMPATSSDSGTEADDESGGVLRGLSAPPIRKKGSSRAVSPTDLETERKISCLEPKSEHGASRPIRSLADEENQKGRDSLSSRRRAEQFRRLSETILLYCVGFVACRKTHEPFSRTLSRGVSSSSGRGMFHPDGRL